MFAYFIVLFILAVLGSGFNYFGVECMRCAFELTGGSAIGLFGLGLIMVMVGLIAHCGFAMIGKLVIKDIKAHLKGE